MKDIKTKLTTRNIKTIDKPVNISQHMKNACIHTKEQAEMLQRTKDDTPADYAEDRATESEQGIIKDVSRDARHQGRQLAERTREKIRNRNAFSYSEHGHRTAQPINRGMQRNSPFAIKPSAKTTSNNIKQGVKGTVRTAQKSVKTAGRSTKTAIKTTRVAAKTTAKSAQLTVKTAQKAAQAARAAAKAAVVTAKTAVKAIATTVKVVVAAVKSLVAVIAAGGWAAVIIIVVICLIALLLSSVFGMFATGENNGDGSSMPQVVSEINAEFSAQIDAIIDTQPHDTRVISNSSTTSMVANWNEVLALYAVIVTTDPENPMEVATLDDNKIAILKTIFWDMNSINYSTETVKHTGTVTEIVDGITVDKETTTYEVILTISVTCRSYTDMISVYGLDSKQLEMLNELLKPEYQELFMRLTGSYVDINLSAAEIAAIMETLPSNLSDERKKVVLTAYSLVGQVKYFWGGKSLIIGWDSRWGTPMEVMSEDSPTTGTVRPFGLDCSGFVDWVFYNTYGGEYIIGQGGGAISQYGNCSAISWVNAQPGDLAFYADCEHAGVVVRNDGGTLTVIHCASGANNVVVTNHTEGSGFLFIGRPTIFKN